MTVRYSKTVKKNQSGERERERERERETAANPPVIYVAPLALWTTRSLALSLKFPDSINILNNLLSKSNADARACKHILCVKAPQAPSRTHRLGASTHAQVRILEASFWCRPQIPRPVHRTVFHCLDGIKFEEYGKNQRTVPSAYCLPHLHNPDFRQQSKRNTKSRTRKKHQQAWLLQVPCAPEQACIKFLRPTCVCLYQRVFEALHAAVVASFLPFPPPLSISLSLSLSFSLPILPCFPLPFSCSPSSKQAPMRSPQQRCLRPRTCITNPEASCPNLS